MTAAMDRAYCAKWDLDSAHGHADTAICLLDSALEHLDGARKTRATEILDHARAVLADLERLRGSL